MQTVDDNHEQLSHFASNVRMLQRYKMWILENFIYDNKNVIKVMRWRHTVDEVHCRHCPRTRRNGKWLQQPCWKGSLWLDLLANLAGAHKFLDVILHAMPFKQDDETLVGHWKPRLPPIELSWNALTIWHARKHHGQSIFCYYSEGGHYWMCNVGLHQTNI
jgi:hypothetical protein